MPHRSRAQKRQVDPDTRDMLKELEMDRLPNITTSNVTLTGVAMGPDLRTSMQNCLALHA